MSRIPGKVVAPSPIKTCLMQDKICINLPYAPDLPCINWKTDSQAMNMFIPEEFMLMISRPIFLDSRSVGRSPFRIYQVAMSLRH